MQNRVTSNTSRRSSHALVPDLRSVGEVDDFVLQEFLTDVVDGSQIPLGGNGGFQPGGMGGFSHTHFSGGKAGNEYGIPVGDGFGSHLPGNGMAIDAHGHDLLVNSSGSGDLAALVGAQNVVPSTTASMLKTLDSARYIDAMKVKRKQQPPGGKSSASDEGGTSIGDVDADQRRKRQREANLQAQRRCRERHRNHVTSLEQEVKDLRHQLDAALDEKNRVQMALKQTLERVESCQQRWDQIGKERDALTVEKEELKLKMSETLRTLQEIAVTNVELETKLQLQRNSGGLDASEETHTRPAKVTLGADAQDLVAKAVKEREGGASELSGEVSSGMRGLVDKLIEHFQAFLRDGNACSSIATFSLLSQQQKAAEPGAMPPCVAMVATGPNSSQSLRDVAHSTARELDLTDEQRTAIVRCWKAHSQTMREMFDKRMQLTKEALKLQSTSPGANLVDFMSIKSGVLSRGVKCEEEIVQSGGILSLTEFAIHACKVEQVIEQLRTNIGMEQQQNFRLVNHMVREVLTPFQTCKICSVWPEGGCPDLLACTRAMTMQSMEKMPHLIDEEPACF